MINAKMPDKYLNNRAKITYMPSGVYWISVEAILVDEFNDVWVDKDYIYHKKWAIENPIAIRIIGEDCVISLVNSLDERWSTMSPEAISMRLDDLIPVTRISELPLSN